MKTTRHLIQAALMLFFIAVMFISCRTYQPAETFYYTLDYLPYTEDASLKRNQPLPYSVLIHPVEIPRTYTRRNIIIRHFGPKISFAENDLWAGRISDYFPRITGSRLQAYNSFRNVSMEHLTSMPDLEIDINLQRLELVQSENLNEAHLELSFILHRTVNRTSLVSYSSRRVRKLYDSSMELFVQTVNEMILEETDRFIEKIYNYFDNGGETVPDSGVIPEFSPLELVEDYNVIEGQGILLMPALSGIKGLGKYLAADSSNRVFVGEYGVDLPLDEGIYRIEYGSGTQDFLMKQTGIRVNRGYRTLVEPDWGALSVEIVDERRNPQDVIYEVFDAATGQSYGSEYPAREELGDPPRIWHLKPGLYKITINNQPFNTLRDFTTINIEEGKWRRLTIVVSPGLPFELIGAGLLDEFDRGITEGNWRLSSALHGSMDFQASHEKEVKDASYNYDLITQFDNHLRFNSGRFSLSIIHYSELGLDYEKDKKLTVSSDIFDLKNSGVVDLIGGIGLYTRIDLNTHLFPKFDDFLEPSTYRIFDVSNPDNIKLVEEKSGQDRIQTAPPFFPLVLKEGIGLNLKLLNNPRSNLTFRSGFGLRQDFNSGVLISDGKTEYSYNELEDKYSAGLELSALGLFQPFSRVQINTIADVLFPFVEGDDITFQWESGINLVILKYLSLNYKFSMKTETSQTVSDETGFRYEHRLLFRLSYMLN